MLEQPEGLQEAGQRWLVYDITAACAAAANTDGADDADGADSAATDASTDDDDDDDDDDNDDDDDEAADTTVDASVDAGTVLAGTCALLRVLRGAAARSKVPSHRSRPRGRPLLHRPTRPPRARLRRFLVAADSALAPAQSRRPPCRWSPRCGRQHRAAVRAAQGSVLHHGRRSARAPRIGLERG